jgi:hypothetical protein
MARFGRNFSAVPFDTLIAGDTLLVGSDAPLVIDDPLAGAVEATYLTVPRDKTARAMCCHRPHASALQCAGAPSAATARRKEHGSDGTILSKKRSGGLAQASPRKRRATRPAGAIVR